MDKLEKDDVKFIDLQFTGLFGGGVDMANYKYYQESGGSGKVNTADHVDEINIINELRVVIEDFAAALGHSKLGDALYPKNLLAGGTFDIKRVITKTGTATLVISEAGLILV